MLRRVAIVSFALATALVVACGHQVTPEPSILNSNLAGKMLIRFRTSGPLDFNSYAYAIIIDSCGNNGVPLPNVFGTSYNNYSYGFFIGAGYGVAAPQLFQYYVNPNSAGNLTYLSKPVDPSLVQFNPNSNGSNTEFTITFARSLLNNPFQVPQPCPNVTQPPATSGPTSGATTAPTPTPTGGPTAAASPSATPSSQPTTTAQSTWTFNFFSFDSGHHVLDSLGINGPTDTSWNGAPVNVNTLTFLPIFRPAGSNPASAQSAALNGGEIDNYP